MAHDLDAQGLAEDLAPRRDESVGEVGSMHSKCLDNGRVRTEERDESVGMCGDLVERCGDAACVTAIGMDGGEQPTERAPPARTASEEDGAWMAGVHPRAASCRARALRGSAAYPVG